MNTICVIGLSLATIAYIGLVVCVMAAVMISKRN